MVRRAGELTGTKYGSDQRVDKALRILGDHGRSLTFLIADGVLPSNEERGYVLRRVMRRAIREARRLGREEAVLPELIDTTVSLMGDVYPEIKERRDFIIEVASREEERFDATLKQGLSLLQEEVQKAKASGLKSLSSRVAFQLHDTFGFPIDITTDVAAEEGLDIETGFDELMAAQRERARAARKTAGPGTAVDALKPLLEEQGETDFVGYEHLASEGRILGIFDGETGRPAASEGDEVYLILDRTPFYAEGGGQVGDRGRLTSSSGVAEVVDTQRMLPGLTGHRVRIESGELTVGDTLEADVDPRWRLGSEQAHTATHVLHWILRDRLGDHARQAGSLVEPGRLRFDFSHFDALGRDQVQDISTELQQRVTMDDGVRAYETSYDFARSIGAMAIFGEKYGDFVRVVEVGEYSKELCGGTHLAHTSRIGVVVVTGEGSVGANLRRIEALVGDEGLRYLNERIAVLERAAATLKTNPEEVAHRIEQLVATHKDMERRLNELDRKSAESEAKDLAGSAEDVGGARLLVQRRDVGVDAARALAQNLKGKLGSAVVVLGTAGDNNANLVAAVTKDLAEKGISARELLAPGAALLGGGAGGKPELAISGGPRKDRLDEAVDVVAQAARDALGRLGR
jgi:alanyl-tRNA synthetase